MTPEELLKPRYKVIADYPESELTVGDIIYADKNGVINYSKHGRCRPESFPSIFKELKWYEELKEKDMPKFMKHRISVLKTRHFNVSDLEQLSHQGWLPATEEEYNNYIKSKQ